MRNYDKAKVHGSQWPVKSPCRSGSSDGASGSSDGASGSSDGASGRSDGASGSSPGISGSSAGVSGSSDGALGRSVENLNSKDEKSLKDFIVSEEGFLDGDEGDVVPEDHRGIE